MEHPFTCLVAGPSKAGKTMFVKKLIESKNYMIKQELYKFFLEPPEQSKKITTKLEDPDIDITTQVINIPPKSSLMPFKNYLKIAQSEGRWKYDGSATNAMIVTVVLKSEKEREKEKKKS